MHGWMHGSIGGSMDAWIDRWMDGSIGRSMNGLIDRWIDEWID